MANRSARPSWTVRLAALLALLAPVAAEETLDDVFASRQPERIATGCKGNFTEGPLWHPDGYLLFVDFNDDKLYRWDARTAKAEPYRPKGWTGRGMISANGLAFDKAGNLLACEMWSRQVTRTAPDGTTTVLTATYEGVPYNSPNDVIVDAAGRIWFTDADWFLGTRTPNMGGILGVYRIDADGTVTRVLQGLNKPNGLALTPDGKRMYIACDVSHRIMRYDVTAAGTLENPQQFGGVIGLPDGIKVDAQGRVFVASSEGIVVLAPDARRIGTIPMPNVNAKGEADPLAANCAFGGADGRSLFVTARGSVFRLALRPAK